MVKHIGVIEMPHSSSQGAVYTLLEKVNEIVAWINDHEQRLAPVQGLETLPGGWISVKDRLPEEGTHVLVYGKPKIGEVPYIVDQIYEGDWMLWGVWNNVSRGYIVSHWMPLPAPPEAE